MIGNRLRVFLWILFSLSLGTALGKDNPSALPVSGNTRQVAPLQGTEPARLSPQVVESFEKAVKLQKSGELEASAELYKRILAESPHLPEAENNLAMIYQALGRTDLARREYEEVLRFEPGLETALNNYATLLYSLGEFARAQQTWEKATLANPFDSSYWFNLSLSRVRTGQVGKALAALQQVIKLSPRHSLAYYVMGILKREHGDMQGALEAYREHLLVSADQTSNVYAKARAQTAELRILLGLPSSEAPSQP